MAQTCQLAEFGGTGRDGAVGNAAHRGDGGKIASADSGEEDEGEEGPSLVPVIWSG
jgi:hypothetical protein